MNHAELLDQVAEFYLNSGDFNGVPAASLGLDDTESLALLRPLIEAGLLYINYGDRHPNPHILAFDPEPLPTQLAKLDSQPLAGCLYPTVEHMKTVVSPDDYAGRPYTLELALGHPQLGYHFFDLSTLEAYRNDPRYYYTFDIDGMISVHDEHFEQPTMDEKDQVLLQTFGLALAKEKHWALVVFRRYLHSLSPEHQQIWKAKQEPDDPEQFQPHPDYWRSSMGEWPEKLSLFRAFLEEMEQVNELAALMGRPPLFRETYHENWPRDFGYLIRPTARELANFASVLDKMLSDNINRDFFQGDVAYEDEQTDKQGRIIVTQKGTIRILDDWIKAKFRTSDDSLLVHATNTMKQVRKARNPQAHKLSPDKYDVSIFKEQIQLMRDAYRTMLTLWQMLQKHPKTRDHSIPEHLEQMKVWEF